MHSFGGYMMYVYIMFFHHTWYLYGRGTGTSTTPGTTKYTKDKKYSFQVFMVSGLDLETCQKRPSIQKQCKQVLYTG